MTGEQKKQPTLLTLKQASAWASKNLNKEVTPSNISYLIQYGRIESVSNNGITLVSKDSLAAYYAVSLKQREATWKKQLGTELNWQLSFEEVKEAETTKHVHRLHPYKGKFIPQLVEYFLNAQTDDAKQESCFQQGDILLEPFCGSGTTLVQANELGMHAIGIDISAFNAFMSNAKIATYDCIQVLAESTKITEALRNFVSRTPILEFQAKLVEKLARFNSEFFPVSFKRRVRNGEINQKAYGAEKENVFLKTYHEIVGEYGIDLQMPPESENFLEQWYLPGVKAEIDFVHSLISNVKNAETQNALMLILSRTIRSCRATTHADLGTLREPVTTTYYCRKHGKICKPLFSILKWWERYAKDSIKRWSTFSRLKTDTFQHCLTGDSRTINLFARLKQENPQLGKLAETQRIKGIFTSPPYVGLINYHEQHAYAYELFGFKRRDELEIGALFKGAGREARELYSRGVSEVLINCKRFLVENYDVFIVANDKFNMYPTIAEMAGMSIITHYKRPVLNRTEKNRGKAYAETILHLKEKMTTILNDSSNRFSPGI